MTAARFKVTDVRGESIAWFVWESDAMTFIESQATPRAYAYSAL